MLIKVCGMRDPKNIRAAEALGIDLIGYIFWDKSPRYASCGPSSEEVTGKARVGVFVDEQPQLIIAKVKEYQLDYIQLHGHESAAYIDNLRHQLLKAQDNLRQLHQPARDNLRQVQIIKAISIRDADDVQRWRAYEGHADMLLFDTKCTCVGGSGMQFDWSVLEQYDGNLPFLLSGGIGPDDAERVKSFHHPRCIGIDLNSRFEDAPGLKNITQLRKFIKNIRNEQD